MSAPDAAQSTSEARPSPLPDADALDRIEAWCHGFRALMAGGIDGRVHTACTSVSLLPEGGFAFLHIEDVERLLGMARGVARFAADSGPALTEHGAEQGAADPQAEGSPCASQ